MTGQTYEKMMRKVVRLWVGSNPQEAAFQEHTPSTLSFFLKCVCPARHVRGNTHRADALENDGLGNHPDEQKKPVILRPYRPLRSLYGRKMRALPCTPWFSF